jgi:ERCC4-related helicase
MSTEYGRERENIWNPLNIETRVKTFVTFVKRRTDIIHNNIVKLNAVLDIYNKFPNRTICFNESIIFAERIKEAIIYTLHKPAISYHSKIESSPIIDPASGQPYTYNGGAKVGEVKLFGKKKLLQEMLNGMREGRYNFLSTARALDEGIDVPNLEQIITTAGSANPIQYSQRSARAKTVDLYNPTKIARIINLYFDDFTDSTGEYIRCRDKQKLRARQRLNDSNAYWVDSIDDIM